jgi:putative ABC transport system permease protein
MKFIRLILKNIFRNKRRTFLTVTSLAVSLFLMITLATILTEFSRNVDNASPLRIFCRHSVALTFRLPIAYQARMAAVPGVTHVTPFTWFGGIYVDQKNFFANFAVDPAIFREIYSEYKMSDDEWQAFIADRQGAIVGQKLVKLYGFQLGQRITLTSDIYRVGPEFIIRGVYSGGDDKTLYFHNDYMNEVVPAWAKDQAGTYSLSAASAADVPRICQAIDSMFLNSDAPTKTESEREFALSFQAMMGSLQQFMYGIMAAIVFSLLLVLANSMAMSVRERTREVGTLKALGFQRKTIAWLFVGESVLVAGAGGALGVIASVVIYRSFDLTIVLARMARGGVSFKSFIPTPETLAVSFLVALAVGAASILYSAYRVSGMTIADALRSTE